MSASSHQIRRSLVVAVVGVFLVGGLGLIRATTAYADTIACGTELASSVSLSEEVLCPSGWTGDGLVIVGADVTLDLNGHRIVGPGVAGIRIKGANARVINTGTARGIVTGFSNGVVLDGFSLATQGAIVQGLTVSGNGRGINLAISNGNLITGNVVSGNAQDGLRLGISSGNTIDGNTISKNGSGIAIADASNLNVLSGNTVSKNRNFGTAVFCGSDSNSITGNSVVNTSDGEAHGIIVRSGSDGTVVEGNGANLNAADGIHVDLGGGCQNPAENVEPIGTVIRGNAANRNGDDGIDNAPTDTVIANNAANLNGDFGIYAPLTCDGGGNVTKSNGNPLQVTLGC